MLWNQFKKPQNIERIIKAINEADAKPIKIMEICGTHTMAISKAGIRSMLPKNIKIISGPGCPVCVTPVERIDEVLKLSENKDIIIATYGDMLRVPGSKTGQSLEKYKALGANVQTVYSAIDAVELAKDNPLKEVVFLGIGFETTAPGTAVSIERAVEEGVNNFYVFSMHKWVEPVLRMIINSQDFDIDGFLCPGHVAVILGEEGFEFLVDEYKIPSVIAGFDPGDLLTAIYELIDQIKTGKPKLVNEYSRIVTSKGNIRAKEMLDKYFDRCDDLWRGIGLIKNSGMQLKQEFEKFDAVKRFNIDLNSKEKITACRCGEVIKGKIEPLQCPLFGKNCTPENPLGPCMVSSEGACSAYFKYHI